MAQIRYIKILTWLRGLKQSKKRNRMDEDEDEDEDLIINFFCVIPLSLVAKLELFYIEIGLLYHLCCHST